MKQKKILVVADVLWTTALNSVFLGVVFGKETQRKSHIFPITDHAILSRELFFYASKNYSSTRRFDTGNKKVVFVVFV